MSDLEGLAHLWGQNPGRMATCVQCQPQASRKAGRPACAVIPFLEDTTRESDSSGCTKAPLLLCFPPASICPGPGFRMEQPSRFPQNQTEVAACLYLICRHLEVLVGSRLELLTPSIVLTKVLSQGQIGTATKEKPCADQQGL